MFSVNTRTNLSHRFVSSLFFLHLVAWAASLRQFVAPMVFVSITLSTGTPIWLAKVILSFSISSGNSLNCSCRSLSRFSSLTVFVAPSLSLFVVCYKNCFPYLHHVGVSCKTALQSLCINDRKAASFASQATGIPVQIVFHSANHFAFCLLLSCTSFFSVVF